MGKLTRIITSLFLVFQVSQGISQDTFSIIAVDSVTGEVGAAGASCVTGIASFGGIKILNDIIPGKGGVNAQAWICINPHINLVNAIDRMEMGDSPQEIIDWLILNDACGAQSFNPEYRQYGIVDLDSNGSPRVAAFTGSLADDYKGHITGPNYSIQGNILLDSSILINMENGFNNTQGSLAEKLMSAMQGANVPGADSRCLGAGTSSTSAFLRVYKATDTAGMPWLELDVLELPSGQEPIDSLQSLFYLWSMTQSIDGSITQSHTPITVHPNPSSTKIAFQVNGKLIFDRIVIYNLEGKALKSINSNSTTEIDVSSMSSGIYYLCLVHNSGIVAKEKFVVK